MNNSRKCGWLVLEGDWGGQIYLTVPAKLVGPDADIETLLRELDAVAWDCNKGDGAGYYYAGSGFDTPLAKLMECTTLSNELDANWIPGGMGGGELAEGLWLHEEFSDPRWAIRACELLKLKEGRPKEVAAAR